MDAVSFQNAVRSINIPYPGATDPPLYPFNPTLDGDFVQDYTYNEFKNGHFVRVPTIIGDATNEGMIFTPKSVNSFKKAYTFVADQFVNVDAQDQTSLANVWQEPSDATSDSSWRNVAADIYGHIRYICPGLNFSSAYANSPSMNTWQYRWNVAPALHVGELGSIWYNGTQASQTLVQQYWISFIRSYDPNKYKTHYLIGNGTKMASPEWETFGTTGTGRRMLFDNKNVVMMENVTEQEVSRCNVLSGMGLQLKQ